MQLTKPVKQFLWTLPQPIFVLGGTILMAAACVTNWMDEWFLLTLMMWLSIPIVLLGEYIAPRRKDWWLGDILDSPVTTSLFVLLAHTCDSPPHFQNERGKNK